MEDKILTYLRGQMAERSRILDERNAILDRKADLDRQLEALGDTSKIETEVAEIQALINEREAELSPVEEEATEEVPAEETTEITAEDEINKIF